MKSGLFLSYLGKLVALDDIVVSVKNGCKSGHILILQENATHSNIDGLNLLVLDSTSQIESTMPENRDKYSLISEAQAQMKGLLSWAEMNARWIKKDGNLELCENYDEADTVSRI